MKEIIFNNKTLYYDVYSNGTTSFFEKVIYKRKKYFLFGEEVTKEKYVELFFVYADANSPNLSKDFWNAEINKAIKILERKKEIESGELI